MLPRLLPAILLVPSLAAAELEVHVLSSLDGSNQPPDPSEKLVKQGTTVTLHALVTDRRHGPRAEVPRVRWTKTARAVATKRPTGAWRLRWSRIEATDHSLSNTDPEFHWHELGYRYVPIDACDDRWSCPAELRTTVLADRQGLGTMAFRVELEHDGERGASTGFEPAVGRGNRADSQWLSWACAG